ncbi:hypothetical protein C7T35_21725 [Variovorax sp. WS11]|uniref:hypothetical protein n=1 Tax=Variovorax sp. WS11 TaxID=1105204 RepID=UPI000D0E025D|nr:hypothetical protein [Variovorax sp. WS11]PSL82454.1 hypothetical protein C7T35_21725 [Variovorax sp. WS11]
MAKMDEATRERVRASAVPALHRVVAWFGFDAGIDYRAPASLTGLRQACPSGVDIYFDNVGGAVRDAVWPLMNLWRRVVVCGQTSEYRRPAAARWMMAAMPTPHWK